MKIKIEKDIPLPEKSRGRPSLIDWEALKVGDSFLIFNTDHGRVYHSFRSFSRTNPDYKITMRKVVKDGKIFYRVWRIN